jgi:polyisoprenoid-binding protein YceI
MKTRLALASLLLLVPAATFAERSPAGAAPPQTLKVDAVHSSVIFRIKHLNVSWFYGRFTDVSGTVTLDEAKPAESSVEFDIKTESVDTHDAKRDKHLKSSDFFSATEFPSIHFKSKSVMKDKDHYQVDGELTLHGVTKPLSVSVEPSGSGDTPMGHRAGYETTFTVKRSDFGMGGMLDALGDEVRVTVSVECTKG